MSEQTVDTIADRYEILERIGAGGSGAVYRAYDAVLQRTVAIKLLRPGHDELSRARLRAEARIAGQLSHPGIARVYGHGEVSILGEPTPYAVMEHVPGATLHHVLAGGPLPPGRVADIVAQVADALAHAHDAGVVHRDVKPANIVLGPAGRVTLLDFGIARQAGADLLTQTGTIVGTVSYMSPEQVEGHSATARSDIFSLGMVAHESLTGRRPLDKGTQVATLLAHATEDVPPLGADVPAGLRELVEQMVRRDPESRPHDAAEVARRARAFLAAAAAPVSAVPPVTASGPATLAVAPPMVPPGPPGPPPSWAPPAVSPAAAVAAGRPRPRRLIAALAGAGLVALVATMVALHLSDGSSAVSLAAHGRSPMTLGPLTIVPGSVLDVVTPTQPAAAVTPVQPVAAPARHRVVHPRPRIRRGPAPGPAHGPTPGPTPGPAHGPARGHGPGHGRAHAPGHAAGHGH